LNIFVGGTPDPATAETWFIAKGRFVFMLFSLPFDFIDG